MITLSELRNRVRNGIIEISKNEIQELRENRPEIFSNTQNPSEHIFFDGNKIVIK